MCDLWMADLQEKLEKASSINRESPPLQQSSRFICALAVYNRLQKEYYELNTSSSSLSMDTMTRMLELGRAILLQKKLIEAIQ
jgi:hypothetical protein